MSIRTLPRRRRSVCLVLPALLLALLSACATEPAPDPASRGGEAAPLAKSFPGMQFELDFRANDVAPARSHGTRESGSRAAAPGTADSNRANPVPAVPGGTEIMWLVPHRDALFAGMGYWRDDRVERMLRGSLGGRPPAEGPNRGQPPADGPYRGAQILVKRSADEAWSPFHAFGPEYLRVDALASIRLERDLDGRTLTEPRELLVAGASDVIAPFDVKVAWHEAGRGFSEVTLERDGERRDAYVRQIFSYRDTVTGADLVFAAAASGALYRGGWDSAAGGLSFAPTPELPANEARTRIHAAATANGALYLTRGVVPGAPEAGGLFVRRDGVQPRWEHLWEWSLERPGDHPGMRGLTAVPAAPGSDHEVLIGAVESEGAIYRVEVDRESDGKVSAEVEFDFAEYFTEVWGGLGGGATIAAYNDMLEVEHPRRAGESAWIIGLWVNHPQRGTPPHNASRLLIRAEDGSYTHREIYDPANPVPAGTELRGARTIARSPFEDNSLYVGGFDAGGAGPKRETAWIYRGAWAPARGEADAAESAHAGDARDAGEAGGGSGSSARAGGSGGRRVSVGDVITVPYRELAGVNENLLSLDIHRPPSHGASEPAPVMIYVHGGGWQGGDKRTTHLKDELFTASGYVFVSVNYRLSPACPPCSPEDEERVMHPDHANDVAHAIRWVAENIARYGGDPGDISLIGHSAGAHLVALIATNERFLRAAGAGLSDISAAIVLDAAAFDLPLMVERAPARRLYENAFGDDPATLRDGSPIAHADAGRQIPPILLVHQTARIREAVNVSFAEALEHGGHGVHRVAVDMSHAEINQLLGSPDSPVTAAVLRFLADARFVQ